MPPVPYAGLAGRESTDWSFAAPPRGRRILPPIVGRDATPRWRSDFALNALAQTACARPFSARVRAEIQARSMRRTRAYLILLTAALAFVFATGCGGDDSSDSG